MATGGGSRRVRTIVCGYALAELPTSWIQVFRRFERAVGRAGFDIRVRLCPLEDLPDSFEVLVVAPDLRQRAESVGRGGRVLTATRDGALEAIGALLREIEAGAPLNAERIRPDAPRIVVHRGAEEL